MQKITSAKGLKDAIQLLEYQQVAQGRMLNEEFNMVRVGLQPLNLIKASLNQGAAPSGLVNNFLTITLGLAAGYVSKVFFVGSSARGLPRLVGNILQFGVTSFIAKNPEALKVLGKRIIQGIFNKKESNP